MPARKNRVTLRDVAAAAGVSIKTASNVKNDWPFVSDETRRRVQQAMDDLGYRPSHLARSLKLGRSDTIGVIVPDIANPFFSTAFRGCEDSLAEGGFSIFLCNTDENPARERAYLELVINHGVDGILLWGSCLPPADLERIIPGDIAFVSVDGAIAPGLANATFIEVENQHGAKSAVAHLLAAGRRRIAYLAGASHRAPARSRLQGYRDGLADGGIAFDPALVCEGSPTISGGYAAAGQLLGSGRPDAFFCYNDLIAIGAITAAGERGLRVPEDIAVIGFDDSFPAALITPMLSTVRIPQYALGQMAASLAVERIAAPDQPQRVISQPVDLVIRESCGTRPADLAGKREMRRALASDFPLNRAYPFSSDRMDEV